MSDHLALVLQGGGAGPYTAPLLIPSLALEEIGARVEVVAYPEFRPKGLELEDAREFDEAVTRSLLELVGSGAWNKITFIAKSRGTLYLAAMSESLPCDRVEAIWVTPLLGFDYVREGILAKSWRSLVVAGGGVCRQLQAQQLVIADANHGLVVVGDVRRTVEGFQALAESSLSFASHA
jgi:hypothetical protein